MSPGTVGTILWREQESGDETILMSREKRHHVHLKHGDSAPERGGGIWGDIPHVGSASGQYTFYQNAFLFLLSLNVSSGNRFV